MTFDPRWLNQLPLSSLNGGDINDAYSMISSNKMLVSGWDASSLSTMFSAVSPFAFSSTPLRSGNVFVAYATATKYKATIRDSSLGVVSGISPIDVGNNPSSGNPYCTTLNNGNVVIVRSDEGVSHGWYTIYDERLNIVRASTALEASTYVLGVTSLSDGNFVIAYINSLGNPSFKIFDIDGDLVKGSTTISTTLQAFGGIVGLKNGNFLVALSDMATYPNNDLYFVIYDRQGTRILAPTLLSTGKIFIGERSLALLSNGQVAIGYINDYDGSSVMGYAVVDENGNIISSPTDKSTSGMKVGGLVSLLNNAIGMVYGNTTSLYFKVDSPVGGGTVVETAYPGTFTNNSGVLPGIANDGKFFVLLGKADNTLNFSLNTGTGTTFAGNLTNSGTLTANILTANGAATFNSNFKIGAAGQTVNLTSNATLTASATTIPTSNAVKSYVDAQVGSVPRYIIDEGNSKVEVQDSTSEATQYVTIQVNDTELGRFEDLGTAKIVRIGPSGDTRIDLNTNTDIVSVTSGATEVLNLGTSSQVLGVAADTAVSLDQSLNIISFKSANAAVGQFDANGLTLATGVAVNKFSNDATLGGYNGATGSDAIVASEKAVRGYIDGIHNAMRDPTGFVNRTDSVVTFVDSTNTLTIAPTGTSYDIFLRGQRYRKTASASIAITDVEGMHYIYFDSTGVLSHTTTFSIDLLYIYAYVAAIYWDAANNVASYIGDERHGIVMDGATHYNLHSSRGTVYLDGLGIGDLVADGTGSLNTEAQFSVSAGTIVDEDITTSILTKTSPAQIPMFYRSGTGNGVWRSNAASNYPVTNAGSGRMAWNEKVGNITWGLTEAVEGYYVLSHIFATNDYSNSRKIIGIAGQTQYATLTAAKEAASVEINNLVLSGLPFAEFVAIGTFIFQTSSAYTNAPKASLRSVSAGSYYMDWRYSKITSVPGVVTDHGSLSGLGDDDHLQYARLSGTRAFTGPQSFNAGLTVAGGYLTLDNGVAINDFSNDTALGGDSSASVPTEHAVKSYVDTAIAGLAPNRIWQGDSYVEVTDGTNPYGYVDIVTDGISVSRFDATESSVRIGQSSLARILVTQEDIGVFAGTGIPDELLYLGPTGARLGGYDKSKILVTSDEVRSYVWSVPENDEFMTSMFDATSINFYVNEEQPVANITVDSFTLGNPNAVSGYFITSSPINGFRVWDSVGPGILAQFDSTGLQLVTGVKINKFSDDDTLGEETPGSDNIVPTERAVKSYVDSQIGGQADRIWEGNSKVQVNDDTTAAGYIEVVADAVSVATLKNNYVSIMDPVTGAGLLLDHEISVPSQTSLKLATKNYGVYSWHSGSAGAMLGYVAAGSQGPRIEIGDDPVTPGANSCTVTLIDSGSGQAVVLSMQPESQTLGRGSDSRIIVNQTSDNVSIYSANSNTLNLGTTNQTIGLSTTARVTLTSSGSGTMTLLAGPASVGSLTPTTQRIGLSTNSRLELAAGTATLHSGNGASTTRLALAATTADLYVGATQIFAGTAVTQKFGVLGSGVDAARIEVLQGGGGAIQMYTAAASPAVLSMSTNSGSQLGLPNNSRLWLDNASGNNVSLYSLTTRILYGNPTSQTFGVDTDSRLNLDQFNDTVGLYAGNVSVLGATTNVLTLGTSGDTYITLNQQDNLINTYTGNVLQMQVEDTGVTIQDNLTVRGNLSIDGTAFVVFNEEVRTADNIITVNDGDPGPGVTRGYAGIEVYRGPISPLYNFYFEEDTETFRVGVTGNTQAVATREDDPDGYKVAWWNDTNRRFETLGTEYIKVDQTSNNIVFATGNVLRGQFDSNGLTLQLGTSVNEFSTDVNLSGASNDAVPTEAAVKSYVDAQIGGQANRIWEGNSEVRVTDDNTATGYITVTADGAPVATFMPTYQLIGTPIIGASFTTGLTTFDSQLGSDGFGVLAHGENANNYVKLGYFSGTHPVLRLFQDNTTLGSDLLDVTLMTAGSVDVVPFSLAPTTQTLGISGDSRIVVDQSGNTVNAYAGGSASVLSLGATAQTFGLAAASNLALTGTTANLFAGTAQVITTTATAQTFGLSANSKLDLANGTANMFAGTAQFITGAATSQTLGISGDSRLDLNQSADTADLYAGANQIIDGNLTSQTFGQASDSRLFLDQGNDLADLYAGTTQIIDGGMTSQIFGVSGDSRLELSQSADTAKLYAGATLALDCGVNVTTLGTAADTNIALNQSAGTIVFESDNTSQLTISITGLALNTGASVAEFSIDGTLVGNSDAAVPTEQAVKTYVDTEINNLRQELDLINIRNVSTDTTASTGDVVLADTTAGDVTIQLMESTDGKIIIKKKSTDGNKVYISTTPGLIDGQSQIIIDTGYQSYTFVCDGTNFFII